MRSVEALTSTDDPAWPLILAWIAAAPHEVEVLPRVPQRAAETLHRLQVSTRSPLGALAWECAGVLIDHGWVRLLGSGGDRLQHGLGYWNGLFGEPRPLPTEGALIVAHDVVGGLFALDGGALGPGKGEAFYFAPERLEWESTGRGHSALIEFLLTGDLARFYENRRWVGWEKRVAEVMPDQALFEYPPPYAREWRDEAGRRRNDLQVKAVPLIDLAAMEFDARAQFSGEP